MNLAQTVHEIYISAAVGCGIFRPFSNVNNFRPEIARDVISGAFVDPTGVKARAKFGLPQIVMNDNDNNDDNDASRRTL